VTRFKLVPSAPDSLDAVAAAQRAVPLVPDSEDDCCERLMRRCDLPSRDVARTWLTFLRALELAAETPEGKFERLRTDPTREHLREAFVERVYGARELLDSLESSDRPTDADALFERFRDRVPTWEHHKEPARWAELWRERVETIAEWLTLLGLAASTPDGYVIESGP
jgi:hypothetical protein